MAEVKSNVDKQCFHCGEICRNQAVTKAQKVFCCTGCKVVYEMLDDHNLCTYYHLVEHPGISLKQSPEKGKFSALDEPDISAKLIEFRNDTTTHVTFNIPNIHCTSCVWLLENLHQIADGILESRVHFMRRELKLIFRHHVISLRSIAELLAQIGYEPALNLDYSTGTSAGTHPNRKLWLKLGVAGFCFGNIMLLSFPEYLTETGVDTSMQRVFGGLNILLALPVLLYSSVDYLKSAWGAVRNGGINLDVPITLGIAALFGRSLYEILSGTGAGYFDSFSGFVFLLLIGRMLQKKTFEHLNFERDYRSYFPISALLVKNGVEKAIPVEDIEPGDKLRVRNREIIPVDAVLQDNAFIDYSFVTGESDPVFAEAGNTAYAGGRLMGTSIHLLATKKVNNTRLTTLWNQNRQNQPANEARMTALADRISPWFTYAVMFIAVLSAGYWIFYDAKLAVNVFTAVLIVACPCALALSGPFTFGSAMNILAHNGLYVKNTAALERLASVDTIVFDKTGTLTSGNNVLVDYIGTPVPSTDRHVFKTMFEQSVHPLSRAVLTYFKEQPKQIREPESVQAVNSPIQSEGESAGTQTPRLANFKEITGRGITATWNGHRYAVGSKKYLESLGWHCKMQQIPEHITHTNSYIYAGVNGVITGRFQISHPLRKGIPSMLKRLKSYFTLHLLTGDHTQAAAMFAPLFDAPSKILSNQTPEQKKDFIEKLQSAGHRVLMVGDGLNDAGAIRAATFGVSLAEQTSLFSPACDAIMDAGLFDKLHRVTAFSTTCITIIWVSFGISLLYNIIGLGFAVTGALTPLVAAILMPLSSISVMIFTTISTRITATKRRLKLWK